MSPGNSLSSIMVGGGVISGQTPLFFGRLTAEVFVVTVKLAAPVLAIPILTEITLGFVSGAMPQMNVFIVSFSLKIGVGLIAMAVPGHCLFMFYQRVLTWLADRFNNLTACWGISSELPPYF